MSHADALLNAITPILHDYLATGVPAISVGVWHKGETRLCAAWGQQADASPATPDTYFDLASVTKLFTTTAFLSFVAQGKVGIDSPLAEILPEFGGAPRGYDGGVDPHSKQALASNPHLAGQTQDPHAVTFRHLLTHTSGLAAWRPVYQAAGSAPVSPEQSDPIPRALRWQRALHFMLTAPFVDPIGTRVRYSDIGLMLLGEAVARLHGTNLETALNERVLAPACLGQVCFNPLQQGIPRAHIAPTEDDPSWRQRRVWGEVHDENACGVGGVAGHAGLFARVADVLQFGVLWLTQASIWQISPALVQEATRAQVDYDGEARGLGFQLRTPAILSAGDYMSLGAYGHTGFTGTSIWIDPPQQMVICLLTNSVYLGREVYDPRPFRRAMHSAIYAALAD